MIFRGAKVLIITTAFVLGISSPRCGISGIVLNVYRPLLETQMEEKSNRKAP
jgi:hypothetical protein